MRFINSLRPGAKYRARRGLFLTLILMLPVFALSAFAADAVHLVFFFSPNCAHCKDAYPTVTKLSKTLKVEGVLLGNKEPERMGFQWRKGSKQEAVDLGLRGVPAMVIYKGGKPVQVIEGATEITVGAEYLAKAYEGGALSVLEAIAKKTGEEFIVTGVLHSKGEHFGKGSKFFLSDGKKKIKVHPWLSVEMMKGFGKKELPQTMSDVLNMPVTLKAKMIEEDGEKTLQVVSDISKQYGRKPDLKKKRL